MHKQQTNNKKKSYLKSYLSLKLYLRSIESLLTDLKSEQNKYSLLLSSTEYYMNSSLLISSLETLLTTKNEILMEILNKINLLKSDIEKNILILKYIHGYTWEEVSELTNYSLRQVYNIHTCAISHIEL